MDSGDEDEVTLGKRDYEKMKQGLLKAGYREGSIKGKETALQSSFDIAYQIAYEYGLKFGHLQGLIETTTLINPETEGILQPLLTKTKEYSNSMFMAVNHIADKDETKEIERNWNSTLLDFIEEFKAFYPACDISSSKI